MRKPRLREVKQVLSGSPAQGEAELGYTHWGFTWKASGEEVVGRGGKSRECKAPRPRPGFQNCHLVELFYKLLLCASNPPSINWGELQSLPTAILLATITAFKKHQQSL